MNEQQRKRVQEVLRNSTAIEAVGEAFALLQELIDADTRFRSLVSAAIHGADTDARSVVVDGKSVFFSRAGDGITDTHTLSPCPHCGGSGAAEDCEQPASVPGELPVNVLNAVADSLDGTYLCGRVWSAWHYGTMSEDDFTPAGEDLDTVVSVAKAAITAWIAAAPAAPEQDGVAQDAERYRWLKCERFDKPYAVTNENMTAVYEGDELDSVIDAAIAAEKGGGSE